MTPPKIPQHEPEVFAAKVKASGLRDRSRVADTSISSYDCYGVRLTSCHGKAQEYVVMIAMVEAVDAMLRGLIINIDCNSNAEICYAATLRPCAIADAKAIALQLEAGCVAAAKGHNGIYVRGNGGGDVSRRRFWPDRG
jgi:hypothetical protein